MVVETVLLCAALLSLMQLDNCACSLCSPNGHPYIITECGGMQQAATCPECGALIGGRSYRLERGNRPSERLYQLARGA